MKRAGAVCILAISGAQAGHLVAYQLRFGALAHQVQSTGVHAYFPLLAKTFLGVAGLVLIGSLLVIGLARVAAGRSIEQDSAPSLLRLLAGLYTLQVALFIAQEAIEGSLAGDLFLWGLLGQLPVALAGAVALRWLLARVGPALTLLWLRHAPAPRVAPYTTALVVWPLAAELVRGFEPGEAVDLRGPPSF